MNSGAFKQPSLRPSRVSQKRESLDPTSFFCACRRKCGRVSCQATNPGQRSPPEPENQCQHADGTKEHGLGKIAHEIAGSSNRRRRIGSVALRSRGYGIATPGLVLLLGQEAANAVDVGFGSIVLGDLGCRITRQAVEPKASDDSTPAARKRAARQVLGVVYLCVPTSIFYRIFDSAASR